MYANRAEEVKKLTQHRHKLYAIQYIFPPRLYSITPQWCAEQFNFNIGRWKIISNNRHTKIMMMRWASLKSNTQSNTVTFQLNDCEQIWIVYTKNWRSTTTQATNMRWLVECWVECERELKVIKDGNRAHRGIWFIHILSCSSCSNPNNRCGYDDKVIKSETEKLTNHKSHESSLMMFFWIIYTILCIVCWFFSLEIFKISHLKFKDLKKCWVNCRTTAWTNHNFNFPTIVDFGTIENMLGIDPQSIPSLIILC